jgi:hypothetical protein
MRDGEAGMNASGQDAAEFRLCVSEATTAVWWTAAFTGAMAVWGFFSAHWAGAAAFGGIGAVVIVVMVFHRFRTSLDRSVHLRVDRFGVSAPHVAHHTVAWSNIRHVKFWRPHRQPVHMCLKLVDDDAAGLKGLHALAAPFNNLFRGAIVLQIEDLEGEPSDIARAIQAYSPGTRIVHD